MVNGRWSDSICLGGGGFGPFGKPEDQEFHAIRDILAIAVVHKTLFAVDSPPLKQVGGTPLRVRHADGSYAVLYVPEVPRVIRELHANPTSIVWEERIDDDCELFASPYAETRSQFSPKSLGAIDCKIQTLALSNGYLAAKDQFLIRLSDGRRWDMMQTPCKEFGNSSSAEIRGVMGGYVYCVDRRVPLASLGEGQAPPPSKLANAAPPDAGPSASANGEPQAAPTPSTSTQGK